MSPSILYITVGIPGSGKSTLAHKLVEQGKVEAVREADHWMTDHTGEYQFNPKKLGFAHKSCQQDVEHDMEQGWSTIQSNTNLRRRDLDPYLDMAEEYGYDVVIIKMEDFYGSIHGVPEDKIELMRHQLQNFDWSDLPEFAKVVSSSDFN